MDVQSQIEFNVLAQDGDFDIESRNAVDLHAHVQCDWDGPRLFVGDIDVRRISGSAVDQLLSRLGCLIGIGSVAFQINTIGQMLVQRLIEEAQSNGIHEIFGCLTAQHLKRMPTLLSWFRKAGFTLEAPDARCLPGCVKTFVWQRQNAGNITNQAHCHC